MALTPWFANPFTRSDSLKGSKKLIWILFFFNLDISPLYGLFILQTMSAELKAVSLESDIIAPTSE